MANIILCGDMGHSSLMCICPTLHGALGPVIAPPDLLTHPTLLLGSQALQCYSYEHTYYGPFDLSALKLPSVSCSQGCSEVVLTLDTGEDQRATKGYAAQEIKRRQTRGMEKREEEKHIQ